MDQEVYLEVTKRCIHCGYLQIRVPNESPIHFCWKPVGRSCVQTLCIPVWPPNLPLQSLHIVFSVNFWKSAPNIKKWTKTTLLEGPKVPFFLPPVRPTGDFDVPPAPGEVQDWEDKTGPWSLIYQIYQPNPTSISKKSQTSSTTHLQLRRENQGKTYESYEHMHAAWSVSIFFVWLKRCIQPGMVPTASLLQRHLLHHQDSFRIQGITLRLGWSHLLLVWGWGISGPSKFQQIHCVQFFFQRIPIANGGFNGKIYGKIINLQGQWGVPARPPARIAPSTSLHWLRRRAWSEPTTIPRPLAGDPCHRRCPFICPRKSCRLGKMRCQYQTNHLRSNTFEKYPWIKWV